MNFFKILQDSFKINPPKTSYLFNKNRRKLDLHLKFTIFSKKMYICIKSLKFKNEKRK